MKKKLACYNLYKPAGNAAREWLWPPGGGFARPGLEEKGFGGLCRRALLAEDFFRPRISKERSAPFYLYSCRSLWHAFSIEGRCEQSLIETLTFL